MYSIYSISVSKTFNVIFKYFIKYKNNNIQLYKSIQTTRVSASGRRRHKYFVALPDYNSNNVYIRANNFPKTIPRLCLINNRTVSTLKMRCRLWAIHLATITV